MRVRQLFMTMPAQLNSCSDTALAGRGVFQCTNSCLSAGQVDRHAVSLLVLCRYCASKSTVLAESVSCSWLLKNSSLS